jgi:hypothetical protein
MRLKTFAIAAGTFAVGLAISMVPAQAQMYDQVKVNMPYTVTLGDKTLPPGDYMIKELPTLNKAGILVFYSDNGMHFETSAMTIPALDPNTPRDTKVTLNHVGDSYYFDKIWIAGKDYGYEFPLPDNVRSRAKEQMASVSLPASPSQSQNSEPAPDNSTAATAPAESSTAPVPTPDTTDLDNEQAAQPAAPTPTPQASTPDNSANREAEDTTPVPDPSNDTSSMPKTSADWLVMLLAGGVLGVAGLCLRRSASLPVSR